MDQYLFKITNIFKEKNRLQQVISKRFFQLDGTLILGRETLEAFKQLLESDIQFLNAEHTRCKPIKLIEHQKADGFSLAFGSCTAAIYKIKDFVEFQDGFLQHSISMPSYQLSMFNKPSEIKGCVITELNQFSPGDILTSYKKELYATNK